MQENSGRNDQKIVGLTFDDGYLDNWVFAFPILKKYKLKGTIFINPEFVDPGLQIRPNLEDVWKSKIKLQELETLGFLSWPEIMAMDESGLIDIQSHSMSHNFYFFSDRIIDTYSGQKQYDWLAWFLNPKHKPFSIIEDQSNSIPAGYPIFEYGRALGIRRYFPDERIIEYSQKLTALEGNEADKRILLEHLNEKTKEWPGRFETDDEMEARYKYELCESKRILEEKLRKKVEYLCWPGGGYNDLSIALSRKVGYKASTLSSKEAKEYLANKGFYKRINRFGIGSFVQKKTGRSLSGFPNHLVVLYKAKKGQFSSKIILKLRKILS